MASISVIDWSHNQDVIYEEDPLQEDSTSNSKQCLLYVVKYSSKLRELQVCKERGESNK